MSASVPIPFPIGATVWRAWVNSEPEYVTCPECAGTLKHTVILGNGETHVVWCPECGADRAHDYDYAMDRACPVGKIRQYRVRAEVEKVTLASVEVRGDEITYYSEPAGSSRYIYYATDLFATEEEARAHADTKLVKAAQDEEDRRLQLHHFRATKKGQSEARSAASWASARRKVVDDLARMDRRIARLKEACK